MPNTTIITHADADGICAGAIAKSRFPNAEIFFSKPVSLLPDLRACDAGNVIICDIAINRGDVKEIAGLLGKKNKVLYFDHHPLSARDSALIKSVCDEYVTGEASASELIYKRYQADLPEERVWVAIYGGIGDYTAGTPFITDRIRNWDQRALNFEASAIVLAIKDNDFESYDKKRLIVETLANGKNPSDIPGLIEAARGVVNEEFKLYELVKVTARKTGFVGYVRDPLFFGFRGPSALFAATVTSSRVGLSVYTRREHLDITLRAKDQFIPLNEFAEKAAEKVGGTGGGHPRAAGARIPVGTFDKFIEELNRLLSQPARTKPPVNELGVRK